MSESRITMPDLISLKKKANDNPKALLVAYKSTDFMYTLKTFKSRDALAKCIRKQQDSPAHWTNWIPLIPLTDGEGY